MKQRKTVIVAFLLAAVLLLGVGYAALSDTLTIDGSAGVSYDDASEAFDEDIYFSKVISGTGCTAEINSDPDTGTITVTDGALKEVGDEVIATYTIKSDSDLDVKIPIPTINNDDSEYFEVKTSWAVDQTLTAGGTLDVTVTIKLIKTSDRDRDMNFDVNFTATSIE